MVRRSRFAGLLEEIKMLKKTQACNDYLLANLKLQSCFKVFVHLRELAEGLVFNVKWERERDEEALGGRSNRYK